MTPDLMLKRGTVLAALREDFEGDARLRITEIPPVGMTVCLWLVWRNCGRDYKACSESIEKIDAVNLW